MDKEEERRFRRRVYKDIRNHPELVLALANVDQKPKGFWVEHLQLPCWCCGTPRAIIHNEDGTKEETCFGRSEINKDRCVPPCKYFNDIRPRPKCLAKGRMDGNCKGTKIKKFEGRGYYGKSSKKARGKTGIRKLRADQRDRVHSPHQNGA